jgi:hypothetical protein
MCQPLKEVALSTAAIELDQGRRALVDQRPITGLNRAPGHGAQLVLLFIHRSLACRVRELAALNNANAGLLKMVLQRRKLRLIVAPVFD